MAATPVAVRAAATLELRRRDRRRWRRDPVAYARERFGLILTPDQEAVLESVRDNPRTYVRAGNGVGKTFIASVAVCWFLECHPDAIVYTTAPSWVQVTDLLWKEVRARHAQADYPLPGKLLPKEPRWDVSPVSFAVGRATDSEERFKGQHAKHLLVVLDEGPGVPAFIYHAASTMLKGAGARLLTIGNPTVLTGPFHDAFHSKSAINATLAIAAHTHPNVVAGLEHLGVDWATFRDAPYGTYTLPADWDDPVPGAVSLVDLDIAKIEYGVGTDAWRVVVEGDFPQAGERALIQLDWLVRAREGGAADLDGVTLPAGTVVPDTRRAGLDVARFGADRSALLLIEGRVALVAEAWQGAELSHTAGRAAAAIRDGYHVLVDTGGLGAAIPSHLKEAGYREGEHFTEVNFGEAPTEVGKARYSNRRSQLWGDLATLLRFGVLDCSQLPDDIWRALVGELSAVEYSFDSKGRIVVEPKEKLKKRIGRSPDLADAFALAVHRAGPPLRTFRIVEADGSVIEELDGIMWRTDPNGERELYEG